MSDSGCMICILACCKGHIIRNQENRALEYRVSLPVPSSRESRVGWRPGRGGTPATALLGPTVPVSPPRHFPTVKRVQYTITNTGSANLWWVMFGCSNDDVLETWRCGSGCHEVWRSYGGGGGVWRCAARRPGSDRAGPPSPGRPAQWAQSAEGEMRRRWSAARPRTRQPSSPVHTAHDSREGGAACNVTTSAVAVVYM